MCEFYRELEGGSFIDLSIPKLNTTRLCLFFENKFAKFEYESIIHVQRALFIISSFVSSNIYSLSRSGEISSSDELLPKITPELLHNLKEVFFYKQKNLNRNET